MSERVFVTGADGFVGRVVCQRLLEADYTPRAGLIDASLWPQMQATVPGVTEFATLGDLGAANPDFNGIFRNVATVVHLAARVHIMRDNTLDPLHEYRRINVDGTVALAQAAAAQGVRRLVFVSTIKVNGESTSSRAFSETDPPHPQDAYALSKWEAEEALRSIAAKTGLEVVIVRPPLAYGPGVRANFLRLMRLAQSGVPLPLPDTKNSRSLVGVENLADFLAKCVSLAAAANQTFLVSDGEDVSTRELIIRLARAFGRPARFMPIPESLLHFAGKLLRKEAAVERLLGSLAIDSDKARQLLGWTPVLSLDNGLAAAARWYLESSRRPV